MAEEKKQQYVELKVIDDARPITLAQAKETGLVKEDVEDQEDGYRVAYADGRVEWQPKDHFEAVYVPISAAELTYMNKLKEPLVDELKKVVKLRGHINEISKKKWSLKRLATEVLKTYDVDLDGIGNDSTDY